jgi:hypothetical protein
MSQYRETYKDFFDLVEEYQKRVEGKQHWIVLTPIYSEPDFFKKENKKNQDNRSIMKVHL